MQPRVIFSKHSQMLLYYPDPLYNSTKSYAKEHVEVFKKDALKMALKVRTFLCSNSSEASAKKYFRHLLEMDVWAAVLAIAIRIVTALFLP